LNEKNLLKLITIGPILFIPLVVFFTFLFYIIYTQELFNISTSNLKEELILKQKQNTISKVKMAVDIMIYERSTIEERLKEKVKDRVKQAYEIGQNIYKQNIHKKREAQVKEMITDALRPMIWNGGESFIFILDKNGVFALAPEYLKKFEQKSIIDFKDATGRYVIQEEIALVKKEGEGFLWDTFTRPQKDSSTQYKQIAFVKDFDMFEWYLGSTEYLDITTKEIEKTALEILRNINKNSEGYFFVFDTKGNVILHSSNPELEGKNLLQSDNQNHVSTTTNLLKSAGSKFKDFVSYSWENPKNGKIETKLSFIQRVPKTEWLIGSGFYTNEIESIAAEKKSELQKIKDKELLMVKVYSIIFTVISLFISIFISKKLKEKFTFLKTDLDKKSNELQELNEELEEKIHKRTQELEDAYSKMQHIANTDSLTQINNRYSFLNTFNSQLKKHKEQQKEFSLIMFDIDYFKLINDTYGHDVGDIVIVEITQTVKVCLREGYIFGRIGGEEFMIFLPHTSIHVAKEIAQRVRIAVYECDFSVVEHVTISLGVTAYTNAQDDSDILKRVDTALYKAKALGRNRVVVY